MTKPPSGRPVRAVRRLLLLGLLVFLGTVLALYLVGRAGRPVPTAPALTDGPADAGLVLAGEGFDYEVTEGGRRLFHIRAPRILSDLEANYLLEEVELTVEREGGQHYDIRSDEGTYNLDTSEATLMGDVRIVGPNDLQMRTAGLDLRRRGRILVSTAPVEFELPGRYRGRARSLEVNLRKDIFILAGEVRMSSLPGVSPIMSLHCQRATYERRERHLRTEGDVELRRDGSVLQARRLSLRLAEDERTLTFARGKWDVAARLERVGEDGLVSLVEVEGDEISAFFDETTGDTRTVELDGRPGGRVHLLTSDRTGMARSLEADHLVAEFAAGVVRAVEGTGNFRLRETLAFADGLLLRRACSETASATFDADGELADFRFLGTIDYQEPGLQAFGERLVGSGTAGQVELVGNWAWVVKDSGRFESPWILVNREEGELRALEGVRAVLEPATDVGLAGPGAESRGPVRVESREATWSEAKESFLFEQDVRVWQGESFLLAEEFGSEAGDMTARGGVKTVWRQAQQGPAEPKGEGEKSEEGDETAPHAPVEVTAEELRFQRAERILAYRGDARVHQAGRTMECPDLDAHLDEQDEIELVVCRGSTRIEDPASGNQVTGDGAVYRPSEDKVSVAGEPVTLVDGQGARIEAREMLYDFVLGSASLDSQTEEERRLTAAGENGELPPREAEGVPEAEESPAEGEEGEG